MGSLARLSALLALAALGTGCGDPSVGKVAIPEWAKAMPGDTMFVAWRPDGAPLVAPAELVGSLERGAAWRKVDVGGVRALAPATPLTTGWKSLAESGDFQEALARCAGGEECYFESALWVEPELEKALARVPGPVARRIQDALQITTLRYVWCVREPATGALRGALETTGTETGFASVLGVAMVHGPLLPPLAKERPLRLRLRIDPRATRRLLGAVIAGRADSASALDAMLPSGLLEPFLERLGDLAGPLAIAGVPSGPDFVLAAQVTNGKALRELCEERFRRKGAGFVTPLGVAVIVEDERLLLFGAKAEEFARHVAGAREADPEAGEPASLVVRVPESALLPGFAGTLRVVRANPTATALTFSLRR